MDSGGVDQPRASTLAREGFDLWKAGKLEEAVVRYDEAIRIVDPNHWARHAYHGEFACVLEALGRLDEAELQLRTGLNVRLQQDGLDDFVTQTEVYFYADFLLRHRGAAASLAALKEFERDTISVSWLIPYIKARSHRQLGDFDRAREFAAFAAELASTETKRAEIHEEFRDLE